MSWGAITAATTEDGSWETIRGRVLRAAERYADMGMWYDNAGCHIGTPDEAPESVNLYEAPSCEYY
jgi:hypothetical protein